MIERRPLGRTGLTVSALGVGTAALGAAYGIRAPGEPGAPDRPAAVEVLRRAADAGVTLFDTAPGYGVAESLVGEALEGRDECVIATKVRVPRDAGGLLLTGAAVRRAVLASVAASREALRRPVLDVLQVHNAGAAALAGGELVAALEEARERGLVRALGASVYTPAEALAVIAAGVFGVVQVPYNLLDRRVEAEVLPAARAAGVAVVARSAFLKGALGPRAAYLPGSLGAVRAASEGVRAALGASPERLPALALRFCLSAEAVACTLVGVRDAAELGAALEAAAEGPLPDDLVRVTAGCASGDPRIVDPSTWPDLG